MVAIVASRGAAHVRRDDNRLGVDADALSEWMGTGSEVKNTVPLNLLSDLQTTSLRD